MSSTLIDLALVAGRNAPAIAGIRDVIYRRGDDDLTDEDRDRIISLSKSLIALPSLKENS